MDTTTTYEIKVRYDNGQVARFVEPDSERAHKLAQVMASLTTARRVQMNKIIVEPLFTWEA